MPCKEDFQSLKQKLMKEKSNSPKYKSISLRFKLKPFTVHQKFAIKTLLYKSHC